jgi:hypothetical protein
VEEKEHFSTSGTPWCVRVPIRNPLVLPRHWKQLLTEENRVVVVFRADRLAHRCIDLEPRCCMVSGPLNVSGSSTRATAVMFLPSFCDGEALHDVQLLGVRRAEIVDVAVLGRKPDVSTTSVSPFS